MKKFVALVSILAVLLLSACLPPDSSVYSGTILEKELLLNGASLSDGYLLSTRDGVEKYSLSGTKLWQKKYPFIPTDIEAASHLSHLNIVPDADGSFILGFSFEQYWTEGGPVYFDPVLAKCDKNGNLLWQRKYEGFHSSAFTKIFIRGDGKIATIGATVQPDTDRQADIYVSLLASDGSLIEEQFYGGPAMMELFYDAEYIEGIGIAALIIAQSGGAYFSSPNDNHLLVLFDDSLNIAWSIAVPSFYKMAVTAESIYLLKSDFASTDSLLRKIDFNGQIVNDTIIVNSAESGASFVGNSQYGLLIQKGAELMFYQDRSAILTIAFDAGNANKIIENEEGFIIVSVRITGVLPTPIAISAVWYSTELIYTGYNAEGQLLWQYTHDNTPPELYEYSNSFS